MIECYVVAHFVLLMHVFYVVEIVKVRKMLKLWMLMLLSKMIQFHALAAADALGKTPKNSGTSFMDITDGLKELDMDNYDDEDAGTYKSNSLVLLCVCVCVFLQFNFLLWL